MTSTTSEVHIKAPLRLSLAGGGTDVEPFASEYGASVLNFAINIMAEVKIAATRSMCKKVAISIESKKELESRSRFSQEVERTIISRVPENMTFEVTMVNPVGAGSGLGTSSVMLIALQLGIELIAGREIKEGKIIEDTFHLERNEMGIDGGFQDYYPAIFGGFNWITQDPGFAFKKREGIEISSKVRRLIKGQMICVDLGVKRNGEEIIRDQTARLASPDKKTLEALRLQLSLASQIKKSIEDDDVSGLLEMLDESYSLKKKYSPLMTNSTIDSIEIALKNMGAKGLKISGAGGGGHMFCFFPNGVPTKVASVLPNHTKLVDVGICEKGWQIVD